MSRRPKRGLLRIYQGLKKSVQPPETLLVLTSKGHPSNGGRNLRSQPSL